MLNVVKDTGDVAAFWTWLSAQPWIALDTETTGYALYAPDFKVRTVQVASPTEAWLIELHRWRGLVEDMVRRFAGTIVCHNLRYDEGGLHREGIKLDWARVADTLIMLRLAEPDQGAKLKEASVRHISSAAANPQTDLNDAMKRFGWDWATVPIDFVPYQIYACMDAILTARLYEHDVCMTGRRSPLYATEMQVRAACSRMERRGMGVDPEYCRHQADKYAAEAEALTKEIDEVHGFSVTSPDQLAHFLMGTHARVHMTKTTPGGKVSVDADVLEGIMAGSLDAIARHVAEVALRVRKIEKIRVTYLEHFVNAADADNLVHADINTIAARTGRMSIREPPLQTLPKPSMGDDDSLVVRQGVVPRREGEVLVSCDYDQMELRLAAILSEDPGLIAAFRMADESGIDFFTASARDIYDDPGLVKADKRRGPIKTYWYSALYGAGVAKQARAAGVPMSRMRDLRSMVADRYPGFFRLMGQCERLAAANDGWIVTEAGRKLKVDPHKSYTATNYRIQGMAADIMKQSLVRMAQAGLDEFMVVPVHDEVLLSVPEDDLDEVMEVTQQCMEVRDWAVPLTTGTPGVAKTWAG